MKWLTKTLYCAGISSYVGLSIISGLLLPVKAESSLKLTLAKPSPVFQISQTFTPPNRGTVQTTAGGATRGACSNVNKSLKPLIPQQKLGLTFSASPTFFFHKAASSGQTAQFFLLDTVEEKDNGVVSETTVNLPDASGIFALTLPADAPSLQDGKRYHWYMSVNCGSDNSYDLQTVEGWIEKTKPSLAMAKQLKTLEAKQIPAVYAKEGIWHETITSSVQLRCEYPNDSKLKASWKELLESVGLQDLISEPLLNSCKLKS